MSLLMLLIIVIILVAVLGGLPSYGPLYGRYGYAPIGIGTILLIILVILLLTGRL